MPPSPRLAFGGHVFDPLTGELTAPSGTLRLPPKPARLLTHLLERPGELVTRDELQKDLWPAQHLEIDDALTYTLRQVRTALGDDAGQPRFIETLPRRGYRFIAEVETVEAPPPAPTRAGPTSRLPVMVAVAGAAVLLAAIAGWIVRDRSYATIGGAALPPIRVALLPLDGRGAAVVDERWTEALLVQLAAQPRLEVVGPATTGATGGTVRPQTEIGRRLGVDFVISGGYRPAEGVLFLQAVRVSDGAHVFARRYPGREAELREWLTAAAGEIGEALRAGGARSEPAKVR